MSHYLFEPKPNHLILSDLVKDITLLTKPVKTLTVMRNVYASITYPCYVSAYEVPKQLAVIRTQLYTEKGIFKYNILSITLYFYPTDTSIPKKPSGIYKIIMECDTDPPYTLEDNVNYTGLASYVEFMAIFLANNKVKTFIQNKIDDHTANQKAILANRLNSVLGIRDSSKTFVL